MGLIYWTQFADMIWATSKLPTWLSTLLYKKALQQQLETSQIGDAGRPRVAHRRTH